MGAGVKPSVFVEHPYPSLPPLKLAMVSRMIWSKGIDLAVEAVAELVAKGMPVELDLYGAPDVPDRRHFSTAVLEDWSRRAGIKWRGPVRDVPAVWRRGHKRRRWPTTRIVALPLRSKSGRQLGSRGQGPAHGGELRQLPKLLQLKR
jgi:glycosyltransferase involved in cell wall biosynthesis